MTTAKIEPGPMRWLLATLLTCFLFSAVPAQETEEGGEVSLSALAIMPHARGFVISTKEDDFLLWDGQRSPDTKVLEVSTDRVVLEQDGEVYTLLYKGVNEETLPPKSKVFNPHSMIKLQSYEDADLEMVACNLACQCGAGWVLPIGLDGLVTSLEDSLSMDEAMASILKQQEVKLGYLWSQKSLIVAGEAALEKLGPDPLKPLSDSDVMSLKANNAGLMEVLLMLARGGGLDMVVDESVQGAVYDVNLSEVSLAGTLRTVLAIQESEWALKEERGVTFVGRPEKVAAWSYPSNPSDVQMELDFIAADLVYVLDRLAASMDLSFVCSRKVEGSVNCYISDPRPLLEVLELVLQAQETRYDFTIEEDFLVIPRSSCAVPERKSERIDFEPEEPWVPVPLSQVVDVLAKPLAVKEVVTPGGLQGELFLRLSDAPAEAALARALHVCGYRYTLKDAVLTIETQ